ncbi:MAG: nitrilase family protein [Prevotellaceae bacterium]|jgi:predicted amidohydrolase|nr:nitrilase family protein [Prevotellaceae bacterium]
MEVALLQTNIVWENKAANLKRAGELIAALPGTVRIAVLPEMFNTGFSMHTGEIAEDANGETVAWLTATAKRHNIAITGSISCRHAGCCFNRLFFVFPNGSCRTYDKRHLFSYGREAEFYTAGKERLIVDYEGWRICPLICYDLRFPLWSLNIGCAYDLLIYVANWPAVRRSAWNALLPARAVENQAYVLGVNRTSPAEALPEERCYAGDTQIVDFNGAVMARAANHMDDVLIAGLDLDALRRCREEFPVLA